MIEPLFLDDLRAEFERIKKSPKKLLEFQKKLRSLTFLDPACGCGNFLVVAYRELRLLELDILRAVAKTKQGYLDILQLVQVNVDQFYGIEIEEFPAQIAQVALWLTDHQMNQRVSEEFGLYFIRLPLVTSPTIVNDNALRLDWETVIPKRKLSYILGNPPFIGHHLQTSEQKADMLAAIGVAETAGVLDYVSAWYACAVKFIQGTRICCAFVSTNSITQGEQVGILWRALLSRRKVFLHFGHRTFRWSNEGRSQAAVFCVIIGFAAYEPVQRLLFDYDNPDSEPHVRVVSELNAFLAEAPWVLLENRSTNLCGMPEMRYGSKPTDGGYFFFSDDEKRAFLSKEPEAIPFIRRFVGAREYLHDERRWVLWLVDVDPRRLRDFQESGQG